MSDTIYNIQGILGIILMFAIPLVLYRILRGINRRVVGPVLNEIKTQAEKKRKDYDNLPEIGRIRTDKRLANRSFEYYTLVCVAIAILMTIAFPWLWFIPAIGSYRLISNAWNSRKAWLEDVYERERKILGS
jgi:p-aminobenzoyl-glutamate transporter AbgT